MTAVPRLLAVMGSGETAPTMAAVHRELFGRLGLPRPRALLLDAPFGFQENADDLTARTEGYFAHNIGQRIEAGRLRSAAQATPAEVAAHLARVRAADYLFAGPGSPTYALEQWHAIGLAPVLAERLQSAPGCVVFASAAALTLGRFTLPVYEIYKVGQGVRWLDGLDVLAGIGLDVTVVPHWDNAEGGTHDTRYCYMGERRLRLLEELLPPQMHILGVDEHTACIIDLDRGEATVRGRGVVTVRHRGVEQQYPAGAVVPLQSLCSIDGVAGSRAQPLAQPGGNGSSAAVLSLFDTVAQQTEALRLAQNTADIDGILAALLALETTVHDWAADPDQSDALDRARAALHAGLADLAEIARRACSDLRGLAAPFIDSMLLLRDQARASQRYDDADQVRAALTGAGVEVHDTPHGTTWSLPEDFGRG